MLILLIEMGLPWKEQDKCKVEREYKARILWCTWSEWWLILCVNLIELKDAQIVGQALFLGCLWGCLGRRFAFEFNIDGINQSIDGLNRTKRQKKSEFVLCLSWDIIFLLPSGISAPGSGAFGFWLRFAPLSHCHLIFEPSNLELGLELTSFAPLVLMPLDSDWIPLSVFLVFYLTGNRLWDFSTSIVMWGNSYNKSFFISLNLISSVFLETAD